MDTPVPTMTLITFDSGASAPCINHGLPAASGGDAAAYELAIEGRS